MKEKLVNDTLNKMKEIINVNENRIKEQIGIELIRLYLIFELSDLLEILRNTPEE